MEDALVFEESHIQPRTLGYVPRGSSYLLPNLVSCELNDTKENRYGTQLEKFNESEHLRPVDKELIQLAQQGDATAFAHLYQLHCRRVYNLCLRMVNNPTEAEDLTQDAFLQSFRKIQTFRGDSCFSTWLHRLTANIVLMRFRKKKYSEITLDETAESEEEYSEPFLELGGPDLRLSDLIDLNLQRAIDQLPDGYKKMFILHDIYGYDHSEIAQMLGCSIGNSKSQLNKARLRLRELLQEAFRNSARNKRELTRRSLATEWRHYHNQLPTIV